MTDHTMVEKVARAIGDCQSGPWEFFSEEGKAALRREAITAITAMREPTPEMLNAAVDRTGAGSDMSWSNRSPQSLFETGFTAMIDALLAGG